MSESEVERLDRREIERLERLGQRFRTWDESLRLKTLYRRRRMRGFYSLAARNSREGEQQ